MDKENRTEGIERTHRLWGILQSAIALGFLAVWGLAGIHTQGPVSPVLLLFGLLPGVNLLVLSAVAWRGVGPKRADMVTLGRICAVLGIFLVQNRLAGHWIILVSLLAAAEVLDWVDGRLAAREGPTRFGAILDEEADALFILLVSSMLYRIQPQGIWVLGFGALRYLFYPLFTVLPRPGGFPKPFSRYSRTVCGITAGILIAGFAEILPVRFRSLLEVAALVLLAVSFLWETVLRVYRGMFRSFIVYYGVPFKQFRMKRMYSRFLKGGDTAFDIGAHLGNRIRTWKGLGVRTIAVEPNPACIAFLRKHYASSPEVKLIFGAAGEKPGAAVLRLDPDNPSLASVSEEWIEEMEKKAPFRGIEWNTRVRVRVYTLDELIGRFGVPQFIKIDAEGYDDRVIAGLSVPVEGISFEFLPSSPEVARRCLSRVEELGEYEYNVSLRETMRFQWDRWRHAGDVETFLRGLQENGLAGDVYARMRGIDSP